MSKKIVQCKTCGADIAKSAKVCPHCGAKRKKGGIVLPLVVVLLIVGIVGSSGGDSDEPEKEVQAAAPGQVEQVEIVYNPCTVDEMVDVLDSNALKAEQTYQDQYMEVTGRLNVIDSDGKYINLVAKNDQFAIFGVMCYIQNDAQLDRVLEMSVGDTVTVRGQITSVGEAMGYFLDIDEIV